MTGIGFVSGIAPTDRVLVVIFLRGGADGLTLVATAAGAVASVHSVGSEDATRSHFEAQDLMEHAGTVAGGWLGRFLRFRALRQRGALSAVAFGTELPAALRG